MRRHAKASSAGSNSGRGASLGSQRRGAFATRGASGDAGGSGAPPQRSVRLALALIAAIVALFAIAPGALAAQTPGGAPTATFGPDGTSGTSFGTNSPEGLAFNQPGNRLYVFDRAGSKIYAFNSPALTGAIAGFPLTVAAPGANVTPADIAVDNTVSPSPSAGNVYYVSQNQHKIYGFNSAGTALGGNFPIAPLGVPPQGNKEVCAPAVDSVGNLFVVDRNNPGQSGDSVVRKYSPSGVQLAIFETGVAGSSAFDACDIAFDSNDDMFLANGNGNGNGPATKYTAASGYDPGLATKIGPTGAKDVAVDTAGHRLYVVYATKVSAYTTEGGFINDFATGIAGANLAGVAVDQANGKVYVADSANHKVYAFGYLTIPDVATTATTDRAATGATLHGLVNPNSVATSDCHFEYTSETDFQVNGFAHATHVNCESSPGSGSGNVAVAAAIASLSAGTDYRFRLVAANANGISTSNGASFTTLGPQIRAEEPTQISSTAATLNAEINPNGEATGYRFQYVSQAAFDQSGFANASLLPASPVALGSGSSYVTVSQSLTELIPGATYHFRAVATNAAATVNGPGSALTTPVYGAGSTCPNPLFHTGAAAGLPDCRAYEQISPLDKSGFDVERGPVIAAAGGAAVAFTSLGAFADPHAGAMTSAYASRRTADGWQTEALSPTFAVGQALITGKVMGVSGDLSKQLVATSAKLTDQGVEGDLDINLYVHDSADDSYQYVATSHSIVEANGTIANGPQCQFMCWARFAGASYDGTHFVFSTPSGPLGSTPDAPPSHDQRLYDFDTTTGQLSYVGIDPVGGVLPVSPPGGADFENPDVSHPVSDDGLRVYFESGNSRLYLRHAGQTTLVSEKQSDHSTVGGTLWGTSSDGALAFLTSTEKLTADASPGGLGAVSDLYRYDDNAAGNKLTDLTPDSVDLGGADVKNVLGVSSDGAYVYFIATGELAAGAAAGKSNLYVWHGGTTRLIATLASKAGQLDAHFSDHNDYWHASDNGRYLAFLFGGKLNASQLRSHAASPFLQAYLYDYQADAISCASCVESVTPSADVTLHGRSTKAGIGTRPFKNSETGLVRNVTNLGQLFFQSKDPLRSADVNGKQDVYQYESGQLSLISSGQNDDDSYFGDASADGEDVYFLTREQLVGRDTDGLVDLYDARVGGGLASQSAVAQGAVCQGDACQGQFTSPPGGAGPGTSQFEGPGNQKQSLNCKQGFLKRHGRCVKKKKRHAKHHHRRAAANNRRNAR